MSAKKAPATIESIRRQLAESEANTGGLRAKLAKLEAAETGNPTPVCGLDLLWDAALPVSRQRSSKHLCRKAWARIPSAERPTIREAVEALKAWNRCDQWFLNDNIYAKGVDKYISQRLWECIPEKAKGAPMHRNMSNPQPPTRQAAGEGITDPAEIARLLGIKTKPAAVPKILARMHGPEQIAEMLNMINAARNATAH